MFASNMLLTIIMSTGAQWMFLQAILALWLHGNAQKKYQVMPLLAVGELKWLLLAHFVYMSKLNL